MKDNSSLGSLVVLDTSEFKIRCSATLRIIGDLGDPRRVGEILGLEATRSFRKGDRRGVRSPPYPHDMWAYTPSVDERSILDLHIQGLWAAIRGRASEIRDLAKCVTVDVFCTYSSNGPIGGFDISVESLELFKELDIPLGVSIVVFEEDGSDSEAFDGMVDLLENPTTH